MITEEQISKNRDLYIDILESVDREGIDNLIKFIKTTDFFEAPASTIYHNNFKGGLCLHSINVYYNALKVAEGFYEQIPMDSLKVACLLHDISKADFYELYIQNKKNYNANGASKDTAGRFDWVTVERYKVRDSMDRPFVYGDHGTNSYMIASKFIKINEAEACAIINHHMALDNAPVRQDISEIYNRHPLATVVHVADTLATYITENPYMINE